MPTQLITIKEQLSEIVSAACIGCVGRIPLAYLLGILTYLIGGENFASGIAIIVLISIDLITALMAQYKIGEPIESRKILKTVTKLAVYGLFLSAIHLTEIVLPGTTFLDGAALAFLALTEAVSVMENIGNMGYAVPLKLLNRLRELKDQK